MTFDLNELSHVRDEISAVLLDNTPKQTLKINNFKEIFFSNLPQDVSENLPGGGCGPNMVAAYAKPECCYEPLITAAFICLAKHINQLKIVDVGALWGHTSFVAGSIFPAIESHFFEMNPRTCDILNKNIDLNSNASAIYKLHHVLLANKNTTCEVTFKHYTARYGNNEGGKPISKFKIARENFKNVIRRFRNKDSNGYYEAQTMRVAKLDDFLNEIEFEPNVIKIDVEGSQFDIVSGALDFIKKNHPILLIEFDEPEAANYIGRTNAELVFLLRSLGYRCIWGDHRKRGSPLIELNEESTINVEINSLGIFF